LCPVIRREKENILSWAKRAQTKLHAAYFKVPEDKLYALTYSYEKCALQHPWATNLILSLSLSQGSPREG